MALESCETYNGARVYIAQSWVRKPHNLTDTHAAAELPECLTTRAVGTSSLSRLCGGGRLGAWLPSRRSLPQATTATWHLPWTGEPAHVVAAARSPLRCGADSRRCASAAGRSARRSWTRRSPTRTRSRSCSWSASTPSWRPSSSARSSTVRDRTVCPVLVLRVDVRCTQMPRGRYSSPSLRSAPTPHSTRCDSGSLATMILLFKHAGLTIPRR